MKRHTWADIKTQVKPETRARIEAEASPLSEQLHLSQLRKARGLTQEAVAELLGVSQAEVSKMERRSELYHWHVEEVHRGDERRTGAGGPFSRRRRGSDQAGRDGGRCLKTARDAGSPPTRLQEVPAAPAGGGRRALRGEPQGPPRSRSGPPDDGPPHDPGRAAAVGRAARQDPGVRLPRVLRWVDEPQSPIGPHQHPRSGSSWMLPTWRPRCAGASTRRSPGARIASS